MRIASSQYPQPIAGRRGRVGRTVALAVMYAVLAVGLAAFSGQSQCANGRDSNLTWSFDLNC